MNSNLNLTTKDTTIGVRNDTNNKALDYFNSLTDAEVKDNKNNQVEYSNKFNLFEYVEK